MLKNLIPKLKPQKSASRETNRKLGLNIGRSAIVGLEVVRDRNTFTAERAGRASLKSDAPLAPQLIEFLKTGGFEAKQANVSLKGQGVVCRFLKFPKMSKAEFESAIQFEAEKYLPFSLAEVFLDFHINPSEEAADPNSMEVVLVAARKTEVDKMVSAVKSAGLTVDLVDLDVFACANALEAAVPDVSKETIAVIDFGAADTSLCISEKGVVKFCRDIAFGGNDLADAVRKKMNLSPEEAERFINRASTFGEEGLKRIANEALDRLFQELKMSLTYYYNQREGAAEITSAYVSGGFSQNGLLFERLKQEMGMQIKRWNPLEKFKLGSALKKETAEELTPYLAVAAGLAVRGT